MSASFGTNRFLNIRLPAGTRAIVTNSGEREIILPPDTELRVLRVEEGRLASFSNAPITRIVADVVEQE